MSKFKSLFGPLALAVAAVFMNPSPAEAARVLLLVDTETGETTVLESALRSAGHTVTRFPREYEYSGSNLSNFDVIVHMNGTTFEQSMPIPTQRALVEFVRGGGGFVGAQWLGLEESNTGTQVNMPDLVLMGGTMESAIDGCESCDYRSRPSRTPRVAGDSHRVTHQWWILGRYTEDLYRQQSANRVDATQWH